MEFASTLRAEINCGFALLRDIATGRDLKKFLTVRIMLSLYFLVIFNNSFLVLDIINVRIIRIFIELYSCVSGHCCFVGSVNCGKLVQFLNVVLHK